MLPSGTARRLVERAKRPESSKFKLVMILARFALC
jgi:hypothetical protein